MSATRLALALQGGGAHGAFTWGVLDRLLESPDLDIASVSGTSAGAMNACVLAQGLLVDGRDGARAALTSFWRALSEIGRAAFNPYQTTPMHSLARAWNLDWSPASLWLDVLAQFVSPYQLNPLDRNPLRDLVIDQLDFGALQGADAIRLFICATNVKTNHMKVFANEELSAEALLASACLPQLHRAVEVDGEHYWDGGYVGNPVLKPLIRHGAVQDVMIVQINPLERRDLPISARDIMDRLNEVTMNAALMRELDVIATINRLIEDGTITSSRYLPIRFHRIADPKTMAGLGVSSKFNTAWAFLTYLRDAGHTATDRWLADHQSQLGSQATLDLDEFHV